MSNSDHIHDLGSLDNATAYVIQRTARLLRFHLIKFFRDKGVDITPEQWFILFRLYEKDGQSQGQLADKDLNDHPNITRLLDALEKRGFVSRTADPQDRRKHLIYLTEHGRDFMEDLFPEVIATRQQIFNGLTQEDIDTLKATLAIIEQNVLTS